MSTAPSVVHVLLLRVLLLLVCWVSFFPDTSLVAAWISAGRPPTSGWGFTNGVTPTSAAAAALLHPVPSWTQHDGSSSSSSFTALSASSTTNVDNNIQLVECEDDSASIQQAASFLVEAFWLGSRRQWIRPLSANENDDDRSVTSTLPAVSDKVRSALLHDQTADLWDKFGERLGQRRLEGGIILAKEEEDSSSTNKNEILGLVCLTETLLEQSKNENDDDNSNSVRVWQVSDAEQRLKETVASLSPAQRKHYKNASAQELMAEELLLSSSSSSQTTSRSIVCCLSNLAVAPTVRRRGVAQQLCEACEQVARDTWGYSELHLLVEHDNVAARHLYEHKLGYTVKYTLPQETALRVNIDEPDGGFVETQVDTLVLVKRLE